jgi:alanine racemase
VAALGYNDGYPRSLSNRGWMSIRGERCPVVGRVCMDVTMLDVTHLDPPPRPGDEVVVFGAGPGEPDLEALAELADTISYELLTRVSPRVRRIFHASAG